MKQIHRSAICFSNFLDRCSAADLEHAVVIGALGYATEDSVDLASNRYHPLFPGDLSSELCHRSFQLSFLRWSGSIAEIKNQCVSAAWSEAALMRSRSCTAARSFVAACPISRQRSTGTRVSASTTLGSN